MEIKKIKKYLSQFGIKPKCYKGQNFLIYPLVLKKILESADLKEDDIVLEVGPGLGILTKELAKKVKKVIAVEIDEKLIKALKEILKDYKNVEIIHDNILNEKLINQLTNQLINYKIVANLPYSITSRFLRVLLQIKNKPELMVLLLQKEVAERIIAQPGKMSLLSLMVQLYSQPKILNYVGKENFCPQPKVESASVKIIPKKDINSKEIEKILKIAKIGFSAKRKFLLNNLIKRLKIEKPEQKTKSFVLGRAHKYVLRSKLEKIFQDLKINLKARAQDLSLENWQNLTNNLKLN